MLKTPPKPKNAKRCPRESMAKIGQNLPRPLYIGVQSFLTWLTGKPYRGQKPLFKSTRLYEVSTALLSLVGGAMTTAQILNTSPPFYPLILLSVLVTVGGARKISICINHQCVHRHFFGDKRDRILEEILSTLIFTQGFDSYYHTHVKCHHHVDKSMTFESDPDSQLMLIAGLHPSLTDES